MTINGVEKSCMKSAAIVVLLDVLVDAEVEKYDTLAQLKGHISNQIEELRKDIMNNHNYHGNDEPTECDVCHSSMTTSDNGNFDICDNLLCDNEIELKGEE